MSKKSSLLGLSRREFHGSTKASKMLSRLALLLWGLLLALECASRGPELIEESFQAERIQVQDADLGRTPIWGDIW